MKTLQSLMLVLLALLTGAACSSPPNNVYEDDCADCFAEPEQDAGTEPEPDAGTEPDAEPDAEPEVDAGTDAESEPEPEPPTRGWLCLSVLDQKDLPMTDCSYVYTPPTDTQRPEDSPSCEEGHIYIEERPGSYRIDAVCGNLTGYVEVPIPTTGDNGSFSSRLVGSLCYNDAMPIVLTPTYPEVSLGEYLGYSEATRCSNWFGHDEVYETELGSIELDCTTVEEGDCQPIDGRDYLEPRDRWGIYSDGWPIHLNMVASFDLLLGPSEEVTVWVTVREMYGPGQALTIPIIIRN